ncbi:sensor histidine kinase [Panacibacter ginsenosidivorans]|uniref:Oxygen sensor histidine kinase NreB n=1 Tax=Panacibacter ginsenosidivorans TaxID=1813871 RepID=A0A5B8V494_9BACT|nr:ATP-binding protein [Panacibacter ginsenosidivorans]QEC65998.1 sensor histidine kinase [Panacibacter ginsenosidivorans]
MHTEEANYYTAVTVAAVVLGIIIIYFIITMIRHQRRNMQLYKAKINAEISTLENERKRIVADLHDELGPLLSAVKLRINQLDAESDDDKNIVEFANKHLSDIIVKIKEISYNLLPNTLARNGLIHAVEEFIDKVNGMYTLNIRFVCEGKIELSKEKEINIYRIFQETIHNTIKHAKAKTLVMELKKQENVLLLTIIDDGVGFNYEERSKNGAGLGLLNLQSRAEVLNAKFIIDSERDKGTKYFFEIPI